jgi:hypothetical protein
MMAPPKLSAPRSQPSGWGNFAHAPTDRTWLGDSVRGVRAAAKRAPIGEPGRAIDVNTSGLSADGRWIANHYRDLMRHGWRDPLGEVPKSARSDGLALAVLQRLEAGPQDDPYHVERLVEVLAEANRLSVRVELEAKRRVPLTDWTRLAANEHVMALLGRDLLVVKTLASTPGAAARLKPAHAAGFPTMLSFTGYEGDPLPAATYWPITTYCRGTPVWAAAPTQ